MSQQWQGELTDMGRGAGDILTCLKGSVHFLSTEALVLELPGYCSRLQRQIFRPGKCGVEGKREGRVAVGAPWTAR